MLIREKVAIGVAGLFLGIMAYDSAFTEPSVSVPQSGTVVTEIDKPAHRMPQNAPQESVTPRPVPVDPCAGFEWCAVTEGEGLALTPEGKIRESLEDATEEITDAVDRGINDEG